MRGLEHCSTSYASGPHVTVPRFGRQRCPACKPHTQRLRVVAAEAKDMQLIQTAHGPRLPDGSNAFVPIRLNMREAENGDWVDKVDDWWAFWQDGYINYGPEDIEMDDIHDALTMSTVCHIYMSFRDVVLVFAVPEGLLNALQYRRVLQPRRKGLTTGINVKMLSISR